MATPYTTPFVTTISNAKTIVVRTTNDHQMKNQPQTITYSTVWPWRRSTDALIEHEIKTVAPKDTIIKLR